MLATIHLHGQICLQIPAQTGTQPKPLLFPPFFWVREGKETMPRQPWQFSCVCHYNCISAIKVSQHTHKGKKSICMAGKQTLWHISPILYLNLVPSTRQNIDRGSKWDVWGRGTNFLHTSIKSLLLVLLKEKLCICIRVYTFTSARTKVRKVQTRRLKWFSWRPEAVIAAMSLPIFLHQSFERFVSIPLAVIPWWQSLLVF